MITSIVEGLAERLESLEQEAAQSLAPTLDKKAILQALLGKLDEKYTLWYADRGDEFDTKSIAKFINANDASILDEAIDEWYMDARYEGAKQVLQEAFNGDEKAAMGLLDLEDEIRFAIEERDDSNPIEDLLKNAQSHFCFVDILPAETEGCLESYQYTRGDEVAAEYAKIAKASGLSLEKDIEAIKELYHNGAAFSVSPLVWFFALDPLDYYKALLKQYKTGEKDIVVTLHSPRLAIRDHCNGAGHYIETTRTVDVPLSSIKSDEHGSGYSFGVEVCGLVRRQLEIGFTF